MSRITTWCGIIILLIGVTIFLNGCTENLYGTCVFYNPTKGNIHDFNIHPSKCNTISPLGTPIQYDCYKYIANVVYGNKNTCISILNTEKNYQNITNLRNYNNYILNSSYPVKVSKIFQNYCYIDTTNAFMVCTISGIILCSLPIILCIAMKLYHKYICNYIVYNSKILPIANTSIDLENVTICETESIDSASNV